MNANKALWEQGDFTRIAETIRESGEALIERIGVIQGQMVLDVGCGDGTTAWPAAKRGTDVGGVDIAGNLVAAGKRRAIIEHPTNSSTFCDEWPPCNCRLMASRWLPLAAARQRCGSGIRFFGVYPGLVEPTIQAGR